MIGVVLFAGPTFATSAAAAKSADFRRVEATMRRRVHDDGLPGGALLIADQHAVLDRKNFGKFGRNTVIPIASASKWLTAATVMTMVDEGTVHLDDPIANYLPVFKGKMAAITIRQVLSHTSGLDYNNCAGDTSITLEACVKQIAASDLWTAPGTGFRYTSVGYVIAGRIVEVVTGQSFESVFVSRLARPLGMTHTRFTHGAGTFPDPAASATSTLDDYAAFVAMLAHGGIVGDRRVLSASAVAELERDQVAGVDTSADPAVRITHIPTYGLGLWRDVVGPHDEAQVVSGNGAFGFYPWIDRVHATYGIVAVADLRNGAPHAFPASERIARLSWVAAAAS